MLISTRYSYSTSIIHDALPWVELLGRAHTESTRHESTRMSHETHRLSVRGSMDTPMRERRSVSKWGAGEGETLSIHVVWTQCALGLSIYCHKVFNI